MTYVEFENGFSDLVTETLGDMSLEEIEEQTGDISLFDCIKETFDLIPSEEELERMLQQKK